jgi:polyisoprenoid-binding protein YceI
MKPKIFKLILAGLFFVGCNNNEINTSTNQPKGKEETNQNGIDFKGGEKPNNRLLPDKLREIPNEIIAGHFPNPCYAELIDKLYVWKHNTTVVANEDLQLIEYGSFVYTNDGWYLRVTMTVKDFEKYYNCKDGILKKGVVYTDETSWRKSDSLYAGDALWYYIAKDKNGRLIKGIAPIETEGKLLQNETVKSEITKSKFLWTGYGEIGDYSLSGEIRLKKADIKFIGDTLKKVSIEIDMTSISHEQQDLVEHLNGTDFFEILKYPTAIFTAESIENSNTNKPNINGKITIKGVTKPISFPVQITKKTKGKVIAGKIKIDRTQFGIKYNSKSFFGNLGDQAIKNNFDLSFKIDLK